MTRPPDDLLLRFLEGDVDDAERRRVLDALDASPELARELRTAARGLASVTAWAETPAERSAVGPTSPERIPAERIAPETTSGPGAPSPGGRTGAPWWSLPAVAAATLLLAVPTTLALSTDREAPPVVGSPPPTTDAIFADGAPSQADPSYVVVLHGRWPDAADVPEPERARRAEEYWAWTSDLARRGILVAAGDLRWEPGLRLVSAGSVVGASPEVVADPDFVVGMFTLRADSYDEAAAIAAECPHLDYGGSVSVRRVGAGFVTVPGMDDWAGD